MSWSGRYNNYKCVCIYHQNLKIHEVKIGRLIGKIDNSTIMVANFKKKYNGRFHGEKTDYP